MEKFEGLLKCLSIPQVEYVVGIDTYDEKANAYCLVRAIDGNKEVILSKTVIDPKEFQEEVDNLAKYFNAKIVR